MAAGLAKRAEAEAVDRAAHHKRFALPPLSLLAGGYSTYDSVKSRWLSLSYMCHVLAEFFDPPKTVCA